MNSALASTGGSSNAGGGLTAPAVATCHFEAAVRLLTRGTRKQFLEDAGVCTRGLAEIGIADYRENGGRDNVRGS